MWATSFVLAFATLWILQIIFTQRQALNYRNTIRDMQGIATARYLGVGVYRGRFGYSSVAVIVVDEELRILKASHMTGVSVFARFKPFSHIEGRTLAEIPQAFHHQALTKAVSTARQKVEEQFAKRTPSNTDKEVG